MLKIAWPEDYVLPLPATHGFPMSKYEVLPLQLLYEGTIGEQNIFRPDPLPETWVTLTHDPDYFQKLKALMLTPQEVRRTGFPASVAIRYRKSIPIWILICPRV